MERHKPLWGLFSAKFFARNPTMQSGGTSKEWNRAKILFLHQAYCLLDFNILTIVGVIEIIVNFF